MADSDPTTFIGHLLHVRHRPGALHTLPGGGQGRHCWQLTFCWQLTVAFKSLQRSLSRVQACTPSGGSQAHLALSRLLRWNSSHCGNTGRSLHAKAGEGVTGLWLPTTRRVTRRSRPLDDLLQQSVAASFSFCLHSLWPQFPLMQKQLFLQRYEVYSSCKHAAEEWDVGGRVVSKEWSSKCGFQSSAEGERDVFLLAMVRRASPFYKAGRMGPRSLTQDGSGTVSRHRTGLLCAQKIQAKEDPDRISAYS